MSIAVFPYDVSWTYSHRSPVSVSTSTITVTL